MANGNEADALLPFRPIQESDRDNLDTPTLFKLLNLLHVVLFIFLINFKESPMQMVGFFIGFISIFIGFCGYLHSLIGFSNEYVSVRTLGKLYFVMKVFCFINIFLVLMTLHFIMNPENPWVKIAFEFGSSIFLIYTVCIHISNREGNYRVNVDNTAQFALLNLLNINLLLLFKYNLQSLPILIRIIFSLDLISFFIGLWSSFLYTTRFRSDFDTEQIMEKRYFMIKLFCSVNVCLVVMTLEYLMCPQIIRVHNIAGVLALIYVLGGICHICLHKYKERFSDW